MTDVFMYNLSAAGEDKQSYMIEVDDTYAGELSKYLIRYNLRRKVQIALESDLAVWVALPSQLNAPLTEPDSWFLRNRPTESSVDVLAGRDLYFYAPDPRGVPGWSGRMILRSDVDINQLFHVSDVKPLDMDVYHTQRWRLGLPEGLNELRSCETLPLEANADLSGGVSFSKGCYIGQELTARTRFTGVVRRRFVPVRVDLSEETELTPGCHFMNAPIHHSATSNPPRANSTRVRPIGWLRALHVDSNLTGTGLALMRLTEAAKGEHEMHASLQPTSEPPTLQDSSQLVRITAFAPSWWPDSVAPELQRLKSVESGF